MKKSLFALAALSVVAGVASAQSNVTIYGLLDMGVDYDHGKNGSTATGATTKYSVNSGQTSGSRLGFRGSEDLGDGLSAIFTLESGYTADDGNLSYGGRLFGRQSWAGLKGGFGTIRLGRQQTTTYAAIQTLDPFTINSAADAQRVYGYGLGKVDPISRADNAMTYETPNIGGFTGTVGYGFGEQPGSFNKSSTKYAGANYANGPLTIVASYQNTDGVAFSAALPTAALDALVIPTGLAPTATTSAKVKNSVLGAVYDINGIKLRASYGNLKFSAVGDMTISDYMLGLTAPFGPGTLQASWNRDNVTDLTSGVSNQYALGYIYPLSKRTNLYALASYTRNGKDVRMNAWANGKSDLDIQTGIKLTF
jgi:predicted porin